MSYGSLGYLSAFDGITLVNRTTRFDMGWVTAAAQVLTRTERLPNGTIINYDGNTDSIVVPGNLSPQEIYVSEGAESFFASLVAKLGHVGTLTLTKKAGGTVTTTAILTAVKDTTPRLIQGDALRITVQFTVIDAWA